MATKRRRRRLISKSSFSRQCVGRIRDTCSQLTWKSHSPHTHGGTSPIKRRHTLTPAQTSDLHELGHWESKSVKKNAVWYPRRQFIVRIHDTCSQLTWNLRRHTHTYTHRFNGHMCLWYHGMTHLHTGKWPPSRRTLVSLFPIDIHTFSLTPFHQQ